MHVTTLYNTLCPVNRAEDPGCMANGAPSD
jgi:hypothetical protein